MLRPPFPVVLASGSPRRRELLSQLVESFEVLVSDVDEEPKPGEHPDELARRLALDKALAVSRLRPESLVIGGDTVVAVNGDIGNGSDWELLGKPTDEEDAKRLLRRLSGRTHAVITGVALVGPTLAESFSEFTQVRFRAITDQEIEEYVATGEPMDKAGAYAIQGGASAWVQELSGSRTNVIGLPVEALERQLRRLIDEDPRSR